MPLSEVIAELRRLQATERELRAQAGDNENAPSYWRWQEASAALEAALWEHQDALLSAAAPSADQHPAAEPGLNGKGNE